MAEKHFQRQEAEELLPVVADFLQQACQRRERIAAIELELARAVSHLMMLGGSLPPYAELARKKAEREALAGQLLEAVQKIQQMGCVVKDLDQGLVDFPSLLKGQEVYLCWKLGEERIRYWHGIDEGFAGRKPLDEFTSEPPPAKKPRVQ